MPLGNQPKTLRGYVFYVYSDGVDKLQLFSTLTRAGLLPGRAAFLPPGVLILLPGREQNVLPGILSLNFCGGEESPRACLREREGSRCAACSFSQRSMLILHSSKSDTPNWEPLLREKNHVCQRIQYSSTKTKPVTQL